MRYRVQRNGGRIEEKVIRFYSVSGEARNVVFSRRLSFRP